MARTATSPLAYMEAWKTQDYDVIHDAALKEASRQVNEMVKWMNWQISQDPDLMKKFHEENGHFGLIRKSRNYRETLIYNRNKYIAAIEFDRIKANVDGNSKKLAEIDEQINQWLDDQHGGCRRILKIYCHVKFRAGGSFALSEPEDLEYEYDPED